jgi:hypothetical protein
MKIGDLELAEDCIPRPWWASCTDEGLDCPVTQNQVGDWLVGHAPPGKRLNVLLSPVAATLPPEMSLAVPGAR